MIVAKHECRKNASKSFETKSCWGWNFVDGCRWSCKTRPSWSGCSGVIQADVVWGGGLVGRLDPFSFRQSVNVAFFQDVLVGMGVYIFVSADSLLNSETS